MSAVDRAELADLLRARRGSLQPADVGLPTGSRRRTGGLRREEVAQLAGISTTYYTFLEQGRNVRPSPEVLDGLARALRLTPVERNHLHQLVYLIPPVDPPAPSVETIRPEVVELVDRLDPHPAYVTGRRWDVLTANRAARVLWTDWPALPVDQRNMLWWTFTDPKARVVLIDWEDEAMALLARFRAAAARHPDDQQFQSLIERLHAESPEFAMWWVRHDIGGLSSGDKRLRHPTLGQLDLRFVVLQVADDPEQKVVAFAPGTDEDRARIAELIARAG